MANVRPRGELSVGGNEAPPPTTTFLGCVGPTQEAVRGYAARGTLLNWKELLLNVDAREDFKLTCQ